MGYVGMWDCSYLFKYKINRVTSIDVQRYTAAKTDLVMLHERLFVSAA